jgi:sucrose-6-phosphate hydrolase SacC (GH32 family)
MDVNGDPTRRTWVLAASANGAEEGRSTGLAYWTGNWDGKGFTADGDHQCSTPDRGTYRRISTPDGGSGGATVRLTVYMDRSSVEVFVEGGSQTLTSLV